MVEVVTFETLEEMAEHVHQGKENAKASLTPEQWKLCDGQEHWAMALESEGPEYPPILMVVHIQSKQQFIGEQLKYVPEEDWGKDCESVEMAAYPMDTYYREDGLVSYGYLPSQSWDSVYEIDEPDLHDRHASMLMEISEDDFNELRALRQNPGLVRMVPHMRSLMVRWIETVAAR